MSLSYSAITNHGKVSLPSIDAWNTNINILNQLLKMYELVYAINCHHNIIAVCGGCRIIPYCSIEHQTDDWKYHKKLIFLLYIFDNKN